MPCGLLRLGCGVPARGSRGRFHAAIQRTMCDAMLSQQRSLPAWALPFLARIRAGKRNSTTFAGKSLLSANVLIGLAVAACMSSQRGTVRAQEG